MNRLRSVLLLVSLYGVIAILAMSLVGCSSAGAGDNDDKDNDSSNVPATVPADSAGAIDGSAYSYMVFDYYGGNATLGYNTDVHICSDSSQTPPELFLWFNDATDSADIDPGTYPLNLSGGPGTLEEVQIFGAMTGVGAFSYMASHATEATMGLIGVTAAEYDQITGGSVTVSKSGSTYTFAWRFTCADGGTLAGSYTGAVNSSS